MVHSGNYKLRLTHHKKWTASISLAIAANPKGTPPLSLFLMTCFFSVLGYQNYHYVQESSGVLYATVMRKYGWIDKKKKKNLTALYSSAGRMQSSCNVQYKYHPTQSHIILTTQLVLANN